MTIVHSGSRKFASSKYNLLWLALEGRSTPLQSVYHRSLDVATCALQMTAV
jgi:hypothetical protein